MLQAMTASKARAPLSTARGLAGALFDQARCRPEHIAIAFAGQHITYSELLARTAAIAAQLAALGVRKHERVGILFPNHPDFIAAFFAVVGLGAVVVPINPLLKSEEIAHILSDSGARLLIVHDQVLGEAVKALPDAQQLQHLVVSPGAVPGLNALALLPQINVTILGGDAKPPDAVPFAQDIDAVRDLALIVYTSGTTGKPKGAMLTHDNLMSVLPHSVFHGLNIDHEDRWLGMLPLCHIYGLGVVIYSAVATGGRIVILPKFEAKAACKAIERERVTLVPAVPAMYQFMLMEMDAGAYDVSSVRICFCAAAPLSPDLLSRIEGQFQAPVVEGYALTETACGATINPLAARKIGSIGTEVPGITLAVMGEDRTELPAGPNHVGEIAIKGPNVMIGYHNQPAATAEVMEDRWFFTGDLGYRDEDGYFYIVGRKKELIIRGGQNIYPREIEDVIVRLPGVREVAVIGVPDDYMGERVKAIVVPETGSGLSEDAVKEHCSRHLASYKVPRLVEFKDALPRNSTGKVLKRLLS